MEGCGNKEKVQEKRVEWVEGAGTRSTKGSDGCMMGRKRAKNKETRKGKEKGVKGEERAVGRDTGK